MIEVILIVGVLAVVTMVILCRKAMLSRPNRRARHSLTTDDAAKIRSLASASIEIGPYGVLKTARVDCVIDGNTIIVSSRCLRKKIRLDAIDCPKDGQEWGVRATWGLVKMIGARDITYVAHDIDRYGRTVATLYVRDESGDGWINVNARMVLLGHAWVMRGNYHHLSQAQKHELDSMEHWARQLRIGLWDSERPIPPWQWRDDDLQ